MEPINHILLTPSQKDVVMSIRVIVSILSCASSLFVMMSMIAFGKTRGPHRLILILTLCNIGESIANLLSFATFTHEYDRYSLCYFQGMLLQFFHVAAFCWSALIAVNLWLVVVRRRLNVDNYQKIYHIIAWTIVGICTLVPNITKAYGPTNVWCWISRTVTAGNAYRFSVFFIPFYISWLIIVVCYIWISIVMSNNHTHMSGDIQDNARTQIRRLRAYPIIFIVLYFPTTVSRIYTWVTGNDLYWLFVLQVLTAPAVGLANALAYGIDFEVRNHFFNTCIRMGCCTYCVGNVELPNKLVMTDKVDASHFTDDDIIEDAVLDHQGQIRLEDLEVRE